MAAEWRDEGVPVAGAAEASNWQQDRVKPVVRRCRRGFEAEPSCAYTLIHYPCSSVKDVEWPANMPSVSTSCSTTRTPRSSTRWQPGCTFSRYDRPLAALDRDRQVDTEATTITAILDTIPGA